LKDSAGVQFLALVFVAAGQRPGVVIGLVVDAERFIREVLGRKMNEAAGESFNLGVARQGSNQFVFTTGDMGSTGTQVTKPLWLFPEYTIGIRLKGQTIEELVRERYYRNLLLIGLLDLVLIAGAWFVYRTVRREVELARLKSDFVSNVSHELKTPLSLIRMFGETLQMQRVPSEEKKREYYDTIVSESERLTRLVNNILNFSRMEAGKKEYHFSPADLNAIVDGVSTTYESHLAEHDVSVVKQLSDKLLPIMADAEAISEAILNIIDNAIKYSTLEKYVRISTGRTDGTVFVEIEDHGIGIEKNHQRKIFEKFYRVSSGLVHNTKGSGLGLTLVKHIMDAHKGEVTLKSEPGRGSTFRLSFPEDTARK
jgi:two-component system phosphate regulon sensor histidine kinase PhoR